MSTCDKYYQCITYTNKQNTKDIAKDTVNRCVVKQRTRLDFRHIQRVFLVISVIRKHQRHPSINLLLSRVQVWLQPKEQIKSPIRLINQLIKTDLHSDTSRSLQVNPRHFVTI